MKRVPLRSGDEMDAFSKSRKFLRWGRGALKKIKRNYNKRFRRASKKEIENGNGN